MRNFVFWLVLTLGVATIVAGFLTRIVVLVLIGLAVFVIRVIPRDPERDQSDRERHYF